MCQLSFSNLGSARSNRLYLLSQWYENTKTSNKDGFGLFVNGSIHKSSKDVGIISNFGEYLSARIVTTTPVIGHVRLATGVNGKKTIDRESSHPFETDKLVLAHNGVLEFKNKKNYDNHKDTTVDTIIFLKELDQRYDGTNLVQALNDTMALFEGSFAFMIYSKLEDAYYVVRGKTKKLFMSEVVITAYSGDITRGIVVNTEKYDLDIALRKFSAFLLLSAEEIESVEYTDSTVLEEEVIYKLSGDVLVSIGKVKENTKYVTTYPNETTGTHYYNNNTANANKVVRSELGVGKRIATFLAETNLSITELDMMVHLITETPFFSITETEMIKLLEIFKKKLVPLMSKNKTKLWAELLTFYESNLEAYESNPEIKFPYMINGKATLEKVLWTHYN